jgi:hypothetical protein
MLKRKASIKARFKKRFFSVFMVPSPDLIFPNTMLHRFLALLQKSRLSLTKGALNANCNLILGQGAAEQLRTPRELYRTTPTIYKSELKACPQYGHEWVEMNY